MNTRMEHNDFAARRHFMTRSATSLGGLALASLWAEDGLPSDQKAAIPHHPPRAKACIYIYLAGGVSHIDLFDPKPELTRHHGERLPDSFTKNMRFAFINSQAKIMGSKYRFGRHGECGMELSELLPHLATCADDLCLIRSMHTEAFNHLPGHILMNTGVQKFGHPSVGSWILYGLGRESQDLPGFIALTSRSLVRGGGANWGNGFLPPEYQGVSLNNQGDAILNLHRPAGVTRDSQRASLDALATLNRIRYEQSLDPQITSRIAAYEMAFRMQTAAPEMMDLSSETERMLEAYGVNRKGLQSVVATADNKSRAVSATFSRNCLLARRMVERGVRFVTIFHGDWDHHGSLDRGLRQNCEGVDLPIATLIQDLKQRGLLDSTLVVVTSEFGRTCLAQGKDGRDHHPAAFSMLMAGGGVAGGRVHGQSDEFGWNVAADPLHVNDLHATMLHLFGIDHLRLTYRHRGREFRLTDVAGNVAQNLLKS